MNKIKTLKRQTDLKYRNNLSLINFFLHVYQEGVVDWVNISKKHMKRQLKSKPKQSRAIRIFFNFVIIYLAFIRWLMQNGYLSVTREIYTGNPVSLNRVKCRRMYGKNENFIVIYHASENLKIKRIVLPPNAYLTISVNNYLYIILKMFF